MIIGIMQPYFMPYIGYFQLIDAVDIYVNLDHVSFMKRSYMTRNTLKNNTPISIPVIGGSQNKSCSEILIKSDDKFFTNFPKTLYHLYGKEIYFDEVFNQIFTLSKDISFLTISQFNLFYIKQICKYLDIKTQIIDTSEGFTTRKKNEGLQDIIGEFNGNSYINAIGGQKLYTKEDFASQNINLQFIQMGDVNLDNKYASILDLIFRYPKEHIQQQIKKYTLI
jgi:hypothetical protein